MAITISMATSDSNHLTVMKDGFERRLRNTISKDGYGRQFQKTFSMDEYR